MSTFRNLIDQIADEVGSRVGNVLESQIKEAINKAVLDYEQERFVFNESRTSFDTVAFQAEYDLLVDAPLVKNIDEAQYLHAGHLYRLVRQTYEWYVEALVNQTAQTGPSNMYIIYDRKLFLYPQPDQITEVTLSGVHRLAQVPLVDDGDDNAWTNDGAQLIRSRAKADLFANYLYDGTAAGLMQATTMEYYQKLHRDSDRLRRKGTVQYFRQF